MRDFNDRFAKIARDLNSSPALQAWAKIGASPTFQALAKLAASPALQPWRDIARQHEAVLAAVIENGQHLRRPPPRIDWKLLAGLEPAREADEQTRPGEPPYGRDGKKRKLGFDLDR